MLELPKSVTMPDYAYLKSNSGLCVSRKGTYLLRYIFSVMKEHFLIPEFRVVVY